MKVLKCYIENFGKLSNQNFDFDAGLNKVLKDNGYGKTTLATFMKSMFYGLPCTTKKQIKENERKKYMPWQGGNFGGYLEFETENEQYRVERFFGKKESEDTFKVVNLRNGKEEKKFKSETFGETIFDLDAEAFERSIFIPQKELEKGINEKISSKLINMVQGTNSIDSYEKAINIIKEKSSEIKKQRGSSGKLSEVENEIKEINKEIESIKKNIVDIDSLNEDLKQNELKIRNIQEEKDIISAKIIEISQKQTIIANKKYIQEKQKEQEMLVNRVAEIKKTLNDNIVTEVELKSISEKNKLFNQKQTQLSLMNNEEDLELIELRQNFKLGVPKKEEIEGYIEKAEKVSELKNSNNYISKDNSNNEKRKNKFIMIPALIVGLLLVVIGCVLLKNITFSIPCFILGFISLLFALFAYLKNYIEQKIGVVKTNSNNNFLGDEKLFKELEIEIKCFLEKYNINETNNLSFSLFNLKSKVENYEKLKEKYDKYNNEKNELKKEIELLKKDMEDFFSNFIFQSNNLTYDEKIETLKNFNIELEENNKIINQIKIDLSEYNDESFDNLNIEESDTIENLQKEEQDKQKQIDELKETKNSIIKRIDNISIMVEGLDELEDKKESLIESKECLSKEYSVLLKANEFLTKANDNLTSKYKKPMQDGLNKYLKYILQDKYEDFNLDTDLNISFEKYGQSRSIDYLSKGYQCVVDLAIRFALIDVLFNKEKPFIVLDDPFVNLDEGKLETVLKLINEASKEYQLIYFICHNSRA